MKKIKISLLLISLFALSCSNSLDSKEEEKFGKINFIFKKQNEMAKYESDSLINIETMIKSINPFIIESNQLEKIDVIYDGTYSYAYILKDSQRLPWDIITGYCFDNLSGCFIYGTLIVGSNGVTSFTPASIATQQLFYPPVCPPKGEAYAKNKKI